VPAPSPPSPRLPLACRATGTEQACCMCAEIGSPRLLPQVCGGQHREEGAVGGPCPPPRRRSSAQVSPCRACSNPGGARCSRHGTWQHA
jgi:hypothetical protein